MEREERLRDREGRSHHHRRDQGHILLDRRPSTTACPACWGDGDKGIEKCEVRKQIFCTGQIRAAKAEQKSRDRLHFNLIAEIFTNICAGPNL